MNKTDFTFFKKLSKNQKIICLCIAAFIFIDLILCSVLLATKKHSAVKLHSVNSESKQALVAMDSSAKKGIISEKDKANFKFSSHQRNSFEKVFNEYGNAALTVRINLCPTKKQTSLITTNDILRIGFLYKEDFGKNGKLNKSRYSINDFDKIEIQAREEDFSTLSDFVDISFAVKKENFFNNIPYGFYVYSDQKCKIIEACVSPALVGFDVSGDIPFYGFSYNGGKINFNNNQFDFSGSQMIFPSENSNQQQLPQYVVQFSDNKDYKSTLEKMNKVEVNFGGEKFFLNNVEKATKVTIPCGALKNPFGRMEIVSHPEYITSVLMMNVPAENSDEVLVPIQTDPGLILNYQQNEWRTLDYEIFQWDRFPEIIFFDTRDYKVQERFFSRLAYFVEKEGYKGRLLTNEELEGKHGYNAHDYSTTSMADFFNKAVANNFKLNKEELILKKILIRNNLLEILDKEIGSAAVLENVEKYIVKANEGGIVSISRETPDWSRINLLAHEGWHTLFFRDEDFRNFVSAVYYTFDYKSLAFLIDYFKSQPGLGYDVNDEYLMHNEFMAYIMQQKINAVADYFVHCANRGTVRKYTPELADYVRETKGIGFEDAALALNDFVFDKYGIICGNIALVNRK